MKQITNINVFALTIIYRKTVVDDLLPSEKN